MPLTHVKRVLRTAAEGTASERNPIRNIERGSLRRCEQRRLDFGSQHATSIMVSLRVFLLCSADKGEDTRSTPAVSFTDIDALATWPCESERGWPFLSPCHVSEGWILELGCVYRRFFYRFILYCILYVSCRLCILFCQSLLSTTFEVTVNNSQNPSDWKGKHGYTLNQYLYNIAMLPKLYTYSSFNCLSPPSRNETSRVSHPIECISIIQHFR